MCRGAGRFGLVVRGIGAGRGKVVVVRSCSAEVGLVQCARTFQYDQMSGSSPWCAIPVPHGHSILYADETCVDSWSLYEQASKLGHQCAGIS